MDMVLWDSSAVLAVLRERDLNHAAALRIALALADARQPCCITNYALAEAHALLLRKLGRAVALDWLLHEPLRELRATAAEEAGARGLLTKYSDKDWSLCDAISFAVAEARGIKLAFSFDHHFRQFPRWRVLD